MICDLPEHGKAQPNHPDPVGLPLDYMGKCQVFDGIRSDIYDLCRFYILGMTGDPLKFPAPQEPVTHGQIRDLLKLAHAFSWPYLILVHSADSVTAVSLLRELHMAACLQQLQVNLQGKSVKLSFCPFCAYAGGNDLSYLNHIIIMHYIASYGCGKCLKQAFVSSLALHTHKKVCLGLKEGHRGSRWQAKQWRRQQWLWRFFQGHPQKGWQGSHCQFPGLEHPLASQHSPCCSGRGTSHHHL